MRTSMGRTGSAAGSIHNDTIEPRSILLFFALLTVFIAVLTLRAHVAGISTHPASATATSMSHPASLDAHLRTALSEL